MPSNTPTPLDLSERKIIYFDENISLHYARAFSLFEKTSKQFRVISTIKVFGFGCEDPKFFPYVSEQGACVITKDTDFRKAQMWIPLIKEYKVGVFFFKTPKKMNKWIEVPILTKTWPEIRQTILKGNPPFLYQFTEACKLKPLTL